MIRKVRGSLIGQWVITENHSIYDRYRLGEIEKQNKKIVLSIYEALYAVEKGKLIIMKNDKEIKNDEIIKLNEKKDKSFLIKYAVFKDLRNKGYIPKSGLKFGADFRLYEKKRSKHSRWLIKIMKENEKLNLIDIIARNRIAHSTAKELVIAVVDREGDITYISVRWMKKLD